MNQATEYIDENVDVNTNEGLVTFSKYVEDVCDEINAALRGGKLGPNYMHEAEVLYQDLKRLITHARGVKSSGLQLEDADIDAMQAGYNHLLDIADQIGVVATSVQSNSATVSDHQSGVSNMEHHEISPFVPPPLPMIPVASTQIMNPPAPTPIIPSPQIHHGPLAQKDTESTKRVLPGPFSEIVDDLCNISRYRTYIEMNYSSRNHFESLLKREVEKIEDKQLRGFHKIFGFKYANAFYSQLINMTITEVVAFDDQPRAHIREVLDETDIKYEVYVEWIDRLVEMIERTHAHKDTTVGELFVRNFLEEKIAQEIERGNTAG